MHWQRNEWINGWMVGGWIMRCIHQCMYWWMNEMGAMEGCMNWWMVQHHYVASKLQNICQDPDKCCCNAESTAPGVINSYCLMLQWLSVCLGIGVSVTVSVTVWALQFLWRTRALLVIMKVITHRERDFNWKGSHWGHPRHTYSPQGLMGIPTSEVTGVNW